MIDCPRISVLQNGLLTPIVQKAVRTNPELASRGLLIEHHTLEKAEFPIREAQSHILYLHTGPRVRAEIETPQFSGTHWLRPGTVWLMPHGSRHAVCFAGRVEGIGFSFVPEHFHRLLASADVKFHTDLSFCLFANQPKLEHLMQALAQESLDPSEPGHLTIDCIATAIALSLSGQSATVATRAQTSASGLTPKQLRAIDCFIEDHLADPISLQSLADIVSRSPFHFLRAFKQRTGTTPHQYVLERRMAAAKQLLRRHDMTAAEVGMRVGFAHHSHFSRAFRRCAGVTPTEFRINL